MRGAECTVFPTPIPDGDCWNASMNLSKEIAEENWGSGHLILKLTRQFSSEQLNDVAHSAKNEAHPLPDLPLSTLDLRNVLKRRHKIAE
jgi:hypothetical protein